MIRKSLEGSVRCLVEVLSCHLLEESEERRENFSQDSRCPSRDSKRAPPGYEARALPLGQTVRCIPRHLSSLDHVSNSSYEAPHCTVFSLLLLVTPLSYAHTFSSALRLQVPSIYVLLLPRGTEFHIHTKQQIYIKFCVPHIGVLLGITQARLICWYRRFVRSTVALMRSVGQVSSETLVPIC
jgi:hypothetical protein